MSDFPLVCENDIPFVYKSDFLLVSLVYESAFLLLYQRDFP